MESKKTKILFVMIAVMLSTIVCKAADYEEVSYDDLVRQISSKKRNLEDRRQPHPFDQVMLHTGLGYVNSFSTMDIGSKESQKYQNGLELSLGVDLFSENWYAETSFRNFGLTTYGTEEILLKELDLKIGYKERIKKPLVFKIEGGLANRYLKVSDSAREISVDDVTPMLMGTVGLAAEITPQVQVGLSLSGKSALISRTADKSALDFAFGLKASL